MIYSIPVEKHVVAGCLKYPKLFFEIDSFVSEKDFYHEIHSVIFSVIKSNISQNESVDNVLISEKIKNLGITFKNQVNIFDYLQSLSLIKVSEKAFIESAKTLKTITIKREIHETAEKLKEKMVAKEEMTADQIISAADAIYNEKISAYDLFEEPVNIFEDAKEQIELIGNTPVDDSGFKTPFNDFNRLYGGLRPKNLYAFVARPKSGKTTMLCDLNYKICNEINKGQISCLYLDTEMETLDIQKRLVASISGVPFWYIDTGNWRKDKEMMQKVRATWSKISNFKFYHLKVGNKTINEVLSIARRWYYSKVGRGEKAIISYDYLKMTGEGVSESWKEYQVIGDKTDKLKKIAEELNCAVLTSTQMNRSGESQNRRAGGFSDDSSAIALSDRLQWFASYVGIFRRKTVDEIEEDGEEWGTHKLITTASRFQGKEAAGHVDLVERIVDGERKYVNNYISFDVKNFNVEEKGSLDQLVKRNGLRFQIFDRDGRIVDEQNNEDGLL
jgi:replicative DNA helicase